MRRIKIGMANINPTVGAFKSNADQLINFASQMAEAKCTIGSFSELVIAGYPPEDLVQWQGFVSGQWQQLNRFAKETANFSFPTVFIVGVAVEEGGCLYNCAAVVCHGEILGIVPKEKLPTYGVFYEKRTFSEGIARRVTVINGIPFGDLIFEFAFGVMAIEICEDAWTPRGPLVRRAYSGAEIVVNLSASPARSGVVNTRREMISTRASDNLVAYVYTNQVGANDSLSFDGGGFVNLCGKMIYEAPLWQEGVNYTVVDLDLVTKQRKENTTWRTDREIFLKENKTVRCLQANDGPNADDNYPLVVTTNSLEIIAQAAKADPLAEYFEYLINGMITGLAGYMEKTGAFQRVGIALSGGKDSILSLILVWLYAQRRFGDLKEDDRLQKIKDFIHCFSFPTRYNSDTTKDISRLMCEELGVNFKEIAIENDFKREVEFAQDMIDDGKLTALTLQNIQARLRAMKMWNWSNSSAGLFLQTGNMSEKAVGYTTVGGDLMGGYSLIGNLPKTVIIELLGYLYGKYKWEALGKLLATKASAELVDDQEDEKDLMPFDVLDACFVLFAGEKMMPKEIYLTLREKWTDDEFRQMRADYTKGMLKQWVKKFATLFMRSIYKWVQSPETVHLGNLDLDRERALQLPVVQSLEWLNLDALDDLRD